MRNLSFFNWSVKKTVALEPDLIDKARLRLILHSLLLGIIYCVIIIPFQLSQQPQQVARTLIVFLIVMLEYKYLLYKPVWKEVAHVTLMILTLVVWSNIFYYVHGIDILTIQFSMITILASFYILGSWWGIFYSSINVVPLIMYVLLEGTSTVHLTASGDLISVPFSIALCFNMALIVFIHYHFFQVFSLNIKELNVKTAELNGIINDLEKSKRELQTKSRLQKTIIAAVAHDIKGPLKYLNMLSRNVSSVYDNKKANQSNLQTELSLIRDSSSKIYNETENLLQYARLHLNDSVIKMEPFNVHDLIRDRSEVLVDLARMQDNVIVNNIPPDTQINTSKELLSIIIHNILDNAIKFTENDSIIFSCGFRDAQFILNLKDKGRGMPARLVNWCNQPLEKEMDAPEEDDMNKQGLGLIIVKELTQKIHGRLEVISDRTSGTSVSVIIPSGLN